MQWSLPHEYIMGKLIRPDNTKNIVQKNMNKDDHEQCLTESTSSHNTFPWKCSREMAWHWNVSENIWSQRKQTNIFLWMLGGNLGKKQPFRKQKRKIFKQRLLCWTQNRLTLACKLRKRRILGDCELPNKGRMYSSYTITKGILNWRTVSISKTRQSNVCRRNEIDLIQNNRV